MVHFMKQRFKEALESGFDLSRFVNFSAASIQLYMKFNPVRWLFIASEEEEYGFLHKEIVRLTGAGVELLLLEECAGSEDSAKAVRPSYDVVVTTLSCVDEVRRHYPNYVDSLIIIETVNDQSTLFDIALTIKQFFIRNN